MCWVCWSLIAYWPVVRLISGAPVSSRYAWQFESYLNWSRGKVHSGATYSSRESHHLLSLWIPRIPYMKQPQALVCKTAVHYYNFSVPFTVIGWEGQPGCEVCLAVINLAYITECDCRSLSRSMTYTLHSSLICTSYGSLWIAHWNWYLVFIITEPWLHLRDIFCISSALCAGRGDCTELVQLLYGCFLSIVNQAIRLKVDAYHAYCTWIILASLHKKL